MHLNGCVDYILLFIVCYLLFAFEVAILSFMCYCLIGDSMNRAPGLLGRISNPSASC